MTVENIMANTHESYKPSDTSLQVTRQHYRQPFDPSVQRLGEGGRRLRETPPRRSDPDLPLVTVITVCRNAAKTLEEAIHSIERQSYRNIEYIAIDGASDDGTRDILSRFDRLIDYFVSERDDGLYHAMNKGLSLVRGDLIIFLNADDSYTPDAIERLVEAWRYSGCDFTGALAKYISADGSSHVLRPMPFDSSSLLRMSLRHETMLIPAALYDAVGGYNTDYPIIADFELGIRLFRHGASYCEVPAPLLNFSTGGVSNTERAKLRVEMRRLLSATFPFLDDDMLDRLNDPATVGPHDFLAAARAHPEAVEFHGAVRALLTDRMRHGGNRWKLDDPDKLCDVAQTGVPKVSIVIPMHNAADTIEATLDAICQQSLSEIEVICVDDASSDDSLDRVTSRAERDTRISALAIGENHGPGHARNAGVRVARGARVFFLDADDSLPRNALKQLLNTTQNTGADVVRGAFVTEQSVHGQKGGGQVKRAPGSAADRIVVTNLDETPALLSSTEGHWTGLYRTDLVRAHPYPTDLRMGEDSLFLVNILSAADRIALIPDAVYIYQANDDSTMNRMTAASFFDGLSWRSRAFKMLRDRNHPDAGRHVLCNFWSQSYFDVLERVLNTSEKAHFFDLLLQAFAEAGQMGASGTSNLDIRDRINGLIDTYCPHTTMPSAWREAAPADPEVLRIATLTTQDSGGAGIGSQRRVEALRRAGQDAQIFCAFRSSDADHVHRVSLKPPLTNETPSKTVRDIWVNKTVLSRAEHPGLKSQEMFSKPGSIVDFRAMSTVFDDADILHLHWVAGMFDYDHAEELADTPVAWTLADMNAFTGGCHYSQGCDGYMRECRDCPLLAPGSTIAHETWKTKKEAYAKIPNLHVICPSQWLADCAASSSLFGDRPVHMIPNALPVDRFRPTNRIIARQKLGLPLETKLVVFGAESLTNRRKGGDILQESVALLRSRGVLDGVRGLFFGNASLDLGIPSHPMGHVGDEAKLSLIYAAADVFAFPSREDNAPLTVAESLLSGTPVVAFPVGNVSQLVRHGDTGFIAEYEDPVTFAEGLEWVLHDAGTPAARMRGMRAALHVRAHNDPEVAVTRHIALYRRMLTESTENAASFPVANGCAAT